MAFRPNYRMQRAERTRAQQAKKEEKLKKKLAASEQRKAARTAEDPEGGPAGDNTAPAEHDK